MMFKRSASRNQRPKSVRAKQVLQILLLLGICFWLVYQVKYSHDKKREINEKDSKISGKEKDADDLKFGRKELRPRYEKHKEEDEEQENKVVVEDEEEEEGNKLEEDEQEETSIVKHEVEEEEEENIVGGVQLEDVKAREEGDSEEDEKEEEEEVKSDEPEDHERVREGEEGEEEEVKDLENQEQEKPQDEGDRNEEFIDEEKEKEEEPFDEKENEGNDEEVKESQVENENEGNDATTLEDEVSHHGAHEAREEQYKGDDASSAVTHDTQLETMETKELDKSSVAGTIDVEGQQDTSNSSSEVEKNSENGSDSLIQNSTNETEPNNVLPDTDLANSTETVLSLAHEMENAIAVDTTLTKNEEDRSSTDPEHKESSGNTNSTVGSDMNGELDGILRLPSNTNSRDKESDDQNEAGSGVETN